MAVIIINPNSTASMTDAMVSAARRAQPGVAFEGWTSHDGPPAIQGRADGEVASAPLLELVEQAAAQGAEGIIVGCFDDTALSDAQARVACPVVGLGQAAYAACAMRGWRFSVVTTLPVSIPILEENIAAYGFGNWMGRVRASDVPVLALEDAPDKATGLIVAEAQRAEAEDDVAAIVLGCAGMVHVTAALREALDVAIVDPVEAAAGCMAWLTRAAPAA